MVYKTKFERIFEVSDPDIVIKNLRKYLGKKIDLHMSNKPTKKYMIQRPDGEWVHFGQMGYEDFTHHKNDIRRINYLRRATHIKGDWKQDKYSPNNLSIWGLWQ